MMIDFTKEDNQSHFIYNSSSIQSASSINNGSAITTSSSTSVTSSASSTDHAINTDPFSMSFLTDNKSHYNRLLEDLSIVDNMEDSFDELDVNGYDKQVLDVARHVASQRLVLDSILESETSFVNDLFIFQEMYAFRLRSWIDGSTEKDVVAKFKDTETRQYLDTLFSTLHSLAIAHTSFLKDLKARLDLWGPTQLISDVFYKFYQSQAAYEPFMQHFEDFVLVLDTLYRLPSFLHFIDKTLEDNVNRHEALKVHDVIYYVHAPLDRLKNIYTKSLKQLAQHIDPAYPDYNDLLHITQKFKSLEKDRTNKVHDCESHLLVLEAFRTIKENPIHVTRSRRLFLFAHLIKVDLDDITLVSDVRMYFLYNDSLIYCKRQKEKKGSTERKLAYKGKLSLRGADIRQLAPSFLAKMVEVKKPFFRLGKKSSASDTTSLPGVEAFGFEIVSSETNLDAMSPLHQNYMSASATGGAPIIRRHILRTRSHAEQITWCEAVRKAIRVANSTPLL